MVKSVEPDVVDAGSRLIKRPRLLKLLDNAPGRLILLIAPAGYGKTTLARQWLERGDRRVAWYAAGPASADVAALTAGLTRSIQAVLEGAGTRVLERARASQDPQREARLLGEMFAEDLVDWPPDAWLCLDDYQYLMDAAEAEEFFDVLVGSTPLRVLVTSRDRPKWATARRVVYGELRELGREQLALSDAEARRLLVSIDEDAARSLVDRADGWPAVLGLASVASEGPPPAAELPAELYEYFAQELFDRADADAQLRLFEIALMPPITKALASRAFGVHAATVVAEASRSGFLMPERGDTWTLHPLLQAFLLRRFADESAAVRRELVGDVGEILIRERQWDDVFALLERQGSTELFGELLESALGELLSAGRLATLTRWLDFAVRQNIDLPAVDLVDAELQLRAASYAQAEALAVRAARAMPRSSHLVSRAWLVAGRAAHMSNRHDSAVSYLHQAARHAPTERELEDALWVRLVASFDVEDEEAEAVLEHLTHVSRRDPEHELRVAMGVAMIAERRADLNAAVEANLAARSLARRVRDPMTRSAYLNRMAYTLSLVGRYAQAAETAHECIAEAREHRLAFVVQHSSATLAMAELGLRHFSRARNLLAEVLATATHVGDAYALVNARALLARLFLAQRRVTAALEATSEPPAVPHASIRGEYLATRALAVTVSGALGDGVRLAEAALAETASLETKSFALWVAALASLRAKDRDVRDRISQALDHTAASGHVDALVCAYRSYPPLLAELVSADTAAPAISTIVELARDDVLSRQVGIHLSREPLPVSGLTQREKEVHSLLSEGLTNRQIAQTLFISETTVKVHVRSILRKLGVRTRTEAVVLPYRDEE
jgi:LuxR family maltose regulon positive regulatory protein